MQRKALSNRVVAVERRDVIWTSQSYLDMSRLRSGTIFFFKKKYVVLNWKPIFLMI